MTLKGGSQSRLDENAHNCTHGQNKKEIQQEQIQNSKHKGLYSPICALSRVVSLSCHDQPRIGRHVTLVSIRTKGRTGSMYVAHDLLFTFLAFRLNGREPRPSLYLVRSGPTRHCMTLKGGSQSRLDGNGHNYTHGQNKKEIQQRQQIQNSKHKGLYSSVSILHSCPDYNI